MLHAAVATTFPELVNLARDEVGDDRLARAVARGAVTYLEKRVRGGRRFRSSEEVATSLRDVTRIGCAIFIGQRALLEEAIAALRVVLEARRADLCRPVRRGSRSVQGRAHLEAILERVAEIAVRGNLPVFASDAARFQWLAVIGRYLLRENCRSEFSFMRHQRVVLVEHVPDLADGSAGRIDERLDAAHAVQIMREGYPDVVARACRDESAGAMPVRERVRTFRRRRAAKSALAAKGFDAP